MGVTNGDLKLWIGCRSFGVRAGCPTTRQKRARCGVPRSWSGKISKRSFLELRFECELVKARRVIWIKIADYPEVRTAQLRTAVTQRKDEAGRVLISTSSTYPAHDFLARLINLSTKAKKRILRKPVQVINLHFITSSLLTVLIDTISLTAHIRPLDPYQSRSHAHLLEPFRFRISSQQLLD